MIHVSQQHHLISSYILCSTVFLMSCCVICDLKNPSEDLEYSGWHKLFLHYKFFDELQRDGGQEGMHMVLVYYIFGNETLTFHHHNVT